MEQHLAIERRAATNKIQTQEALAVSGIKEEKENALDFSHGLRQSDPVR